MFKWTVKNENEIVVASGIEENYSVAMIKCGHNIQLNNDTSEGKPGYTSTIFEIKEDLK